MLQGVITLIVLKLPSLKAKEVLLYIQSCKRVLINWLVQERILQLGGSCSVISRELKREENCLRCPVTVPALTRTAALEQLAALKVSLAHGWLSSNCRLAICSLAPVGECGGSALRAGERRQCPAVRPPNNIFSPPPAEWAPSKRQNGQIRLRGVACK